MPARRAHLRPNRLPVPPPMRRSAVHSPQASSSRESALERVRRISREHNKPFDPSKRGTWKGSSKDLVVNGKAKRKAWSEYGGHHETDEEFVVIEREPDDRNPYVLVNPLDYSGADLFAMHFGAYGSTCLLVWSGSVEDSAETAAEWLAQYAPGHITTEEHVGKLMEEAKQDEPGLDDEEAYEKATADLTYTEAGWLTSYEWTVDDVHKGTPLFDAALEASKEEYAEVWPDSDVPQRNGSRWSDAMILKSVRDGDMMTPQATERARELARLGLIDTSGTWTLTRAGKQALDEQAPNKRGAHRKNSSQRMNEFQRGFLEAALWSSTDNADDSGGEPLDKNYDISDIEPKTLARLLKDCDDFCDENAKLLAQAGDDGQNGHDFWLTRCGHGAGFWDRGYGAVGDKLSAACKRYGNVDLTVEDDGMIYAS